ncbi:MAG: hypothetical protein ACYTDX_08735 [Planctomycetota bacterium]|jgi:hypothetical protein
MGKLLDGLNRRLNEAGCLVRFLVFLLLLPLVVPAVILLVLWLRRRRRVSTPDGGHGDVIDVEFREGRD